jgi:pimeloyl-ACP methyl ester carboxylesterase
MIETKNIFGFWDSVGGLNVEIWVNGVRKGTATSGSWGRNVHFDYTASSSDGGKSLQWYAKFAGDNSYNTCQSGNQKLTILTLPSVATPALSPASGTTFPDTLRVTATTATGGATIRYTKDGTDPTASSPVFPTGGLVLTATTTVKARAFKAGMADSDVAAATYSKLQKIATPALSPASGTTFPDTLRVTATTATGGATIRYTKDGTDPTASSPVFPTGGLVLTATTPVKARAFKAGMADSDVATAVYTLQPRVVLLLHGMNSDPIAAWKSFVEDVSYFPPFGRPTVPTIYGGAVQGNEAPSLDKRQVRYYRVKFGSYDKAAGRQGLEQLPSKSNNGDGGDFTSFFGGSSLATEVADAVKAIRLKHSNAVVTLVGHSRGGIAGRAFLQSDGANDERASIVGLLTVGTPHAGSPLGRLYTYLESHPRQTPQSTDWELVDKLRGAVGAYPDKIDVRRPTIGDLEPGSQPIKQLAGSATRLPSRIAYGALCFSSVPFGDLSDILILGRYNVFKGLRKVGGTIDLPPLTLGASNAICQTLSIGVYAGDGIVPFDSQAFPATVPSAQKSSNSAGILHTAETSEKADIRAALEKLVNWWNTP